VGQIKNYFVQVVYQTQNSYTLLAKKRFFVEKPIKFILAWLEQNNVLKQGKCI